MKLYKYRDLSNPGGDEIQRLKTMLRRQTFWCARPDSLNDPEEFAWKCEYETTEDTLDLLVEVLVRVNGRTREQARERVTAAVASGRLELLAKPAITAMIQQCRNKVGLVCFGASPENSILWQRYGGNGAGVCIELEVPADLLENQLYEVKYLNAKVIHINQIMRAFLDPNHVREVYSLAFLSKPSCWASEAEFRFISKRQEVLVRFDRSQITGLTFGDALTTDVRRRIEHIVDCLPYVLLI